MGFSPYPFLSRNFAHCTIFSLMAQRFQLWRLITSDFGCISLPISAVFHFRFWRRSLWPCALLTYTSKKFNPMPNRAWGQTPENAVGPGVSTSHVRAASSESISAIFSNEADEGKVPTAIVPAQKTIVAIFICQRMLMMVPGSLPSRISSSPSPASSVCTDVLPCVAE